MKHDLEALTIYFILLIHTNPTSNIFSQYTHINMYGILMKNGYIFLYTAKGIKRVQSGNKENKRVFNKLS